MTQNAASGPSTESDVVRVLDTYIDAFNRQDYETCATLYELPCSFLTPQGLFVLKTPEEFLTTMRSTSAALRKKGLAKSAFTEKHVTMLDERIALVSCVCVRYLADGSPMQTLGGTYNLYRTDDGWKIVTILAHAVPA